MSIRGTEELIDYVIIDTYNNRDAENQGKI